MKRFFLIIVFVASLFTINMLIRSIYSLWQKQDLIVKAENMLLQEKKENEQLKKQLVQARDPHFVEKQARNKLLLIRSREQAIILPVLTPGARKEAGSVSFRDSWKQWLHLFFY